MCGVAKEWADGPAGFGGVQIQSAEPAAYAVAFAGGIVSFLSPCVLPLVPAYLSIVSGLVCPHGTYDCHAAQMTRAPKCRCRTDL